MAGLPEVIGLLYRADWTRLSLSAELRSETDRELLPRLSREEPPRWYRVPAARVGIWSPAALAGRIAGLLPCRGERFGE
jgi:hypothetical protein